MREISYSRLIGVLECQLAFGNLRAAPNSFDDCALLSIHSLTQHNHNLRESPTEESAQSTKLPRSGGSVRVVDWAAFLSN
ncbi:MAG: hypothetical protein AAF497_20955, partial [Planctomycetota bacterium]